jgi:hypothetical protein
VSRGGKDGIPLRALVRKWGLILNAMGRLGRIKPKVTQFELSFKKLAVAADPPPPILPPNSGRFLFRVALWRHRELVLVPAARGCSLSSLPQPCPLFP